MGCRQVKPKQELIRVVRTPAGTLEIDRTGKKAGRGAYLCRARGCWETGARKKALENALHGAFSEEDRKQISDYMQELHKGV